MELNVEIATKLFNWPGTETEAREVCEVWDLFQFAGNGAGWVTVATWSVWTWMEQQGQEPGLYKRGDVYRCHAQVAGNIWEDAPSPAEAICRAALSLAAHLKEGR